jgi:putative integral membrane protein (TIGR02587 family)
VDLGRAFGGALIFSLPMLMTMELWWLGFTMDRGRLALLMLVMLPVLVGLAHRVGFEETFGWREDLRDAFIALGMGIVASALILSLFGVIDGTMPAGEVVGKIAIQAVPASLGALLARSQLGDDDGDRQSQDHHGSSGAEQESGPMAGYGGELFMMAIGALFLSLNVAPTEEMMLISYMMTPWHALALILLSLVLMHGFVYAVAFKGGSALSRDTPWFGDFLRFSIVGYILSLAISVFALWSFGRIDDLPLAALLMATIVLAFPASIGAAAARLIL